MPEPVFLDAITELRLQKAFEKLDYKAIEDLFLEQKRALDEVIEDLETSREDIDSTNKAFESETKARKEAERLAQVQVERADKYEETIEKIYELVEPFIQKKTRVAVIKEIWEIVQP